MKRLVLSCLAPCLVMSLAPAALAWRGGGGVYRGPMGGAAVRGPGGAAAVRGPAGNVAVPVRRRSMAASIVPQAMALRPG